MMAPSTPSHQRICARLTRASTTISFIIVSYSLVNVAAFLPPKARHHKAFVTAPLGNPAHTSFAHRTTERGNLWGGTALPIQPARFVGLGSSAAEEFAGKTSESVAQKQDEEWKLIHAALQKYKAEFGTVRVPARFVVPEEESWPTGTQGLRLGIRVASIRSIGRYVQDRPERVDALERLGFEWKLRSSRGASAAVSAATGDGLDADPQAVSFDAMLGALKTYKELHGDVKVPATFAVPDAENWPVACRGLPLGMCLTQVVNRNAYLVPRTVKVQFAQARGGGGGTGGGTGGGGAKKLSAAEEKALEAEAEAEVVRRKAALLEVGFHLKDKSAAASKQSGEKKGKNSSTNERFERLLLALKGYRATYGDLDVPQSFQVPEDAAWPEETWGLRLGSRVNAIRSQGTFVKNHPQRRELLDELGFRWETEGTRKGYINAAQAKEIGLDGQWEAWKNSRWQDTAAGGGKGDASGPGGAGGAAGGSSGDLYAHFFGGAEAEGDAETDAELAAQAEAHSFDDVIEALEVWKDEFGSLEDIPEYLEVPYAGELGEVEAALAAMAETATLASAESSTDFATAPKDGGGGDGWGGEDDLYDDFLGLDDDEAMLRFMMGAGPPPPPPKPQPTPEELAAAEAEEAAARALRVRLAGMAWPPHLAGLPIGPFVAQMRRGDVPGKQDAARRAKLDAVGFTWGDDTQYLLFDYHLLVRALAVFVKIRGDMCVPPAFTVPANAPWTEDTWGYELGEATNLARAQRELLVEDYPERYRFLTNMGFLWLPPLLVEDGTPEANADAAEATTAHQKDYRESAEHWATLFYEDLLTPGEWGKLKAAFEKGFVWEADSRLFSLDDMLAVEEAHPQGWDDEDEDFDLEEEEDDEDEDEEEAYLEEEEDFEELDDDDVDSEGGEDMLREEMGGSDDDDDELVALGDDDDDAEDADDLLPDLDDFDLGDLDLGDLDLGDDDDEPGP